MIDRVGSRLILFPFCFQEIVSAGCLCLSPTKRPQNGHGISKEWTQNGQGMDTEWTQNGHRMDTEWTQNGHRKDMENQQKAYKHNSVDILALICRHRMDKEWTQNGHRKPTKTIS